MNTESKLKVSDWAGLSRELKFYLKKKVLLKILQVLSVGKGLINKFTRNWIFASYNDIWFLPSCEYAIIFIALDLSVASHWRGFLEGRLPAVSRSRVISFLGTNISAINVFGTCLVAYLSLRGFMSLRLYGDKEDSWDPDLDFCLKLF